MSRIRSIKPEFWTSEQVVQCSPNARLLFVGMWSFCDDGGVHPASVMRLKMEVLPGDPFSVADVKAMVDELKSAGLIQEYEVNGEAYWMVTGWNKHQRIDQPTYRYPGPNGQVPENPGRRRPRPDSSASVRRTDDEQTTNVRQVFDVGEERRGGEGKGEEELPPESPPSGGRRKVQFGYKFDFMDLDWPEWAGNQVRETWARFIEYRWTHPKGKFRFSSKRSAQIWLNRQAQQFDTGRRFVAALEVTMSKGWLEPVAPSDFKYPPLAELDSQTPPAKPEHNPFA